MGKRVLVAEDDRDLRELVSAALTDRGYQVATVGTGSELLNLLLGPPDRKSRVHFDLVVTDVRMPDISGLDVVDQLRLNGDITPVVVITAFPLEGTRRRARALDVRLLAKPFELETLGAAVDWAIRVNAPHARHFS